MAFEPGDWVKKHVQPGHTIRKTTRKLFGGEIPLRNVKKRKKKTEEQLQELEKRKTTSKKKTKTKNAGKSGQVQNTSAMEKFEVAKKRGAIKRKK